MKKRSCRMTPEEKEIHALAVKVRKMTDQQISDFLDEVRADAYQEGAAASGSGKVDQILDELAAGHCPGIGRATVIRLRGYIGGRDEQKN